MVCKDTVVKRATSSATTLHFNLKCSTKFENRNTIKNICSCQKITLNYINSEQIAVILSFILTTAVLLHSCVN